MLLERIRYRETTKFRFLSSVFSGPTDPGEEVLSLLKTVKYDIEEMRLLEPTLLPPDGKYTNIYFNP